MRGKLILFYPFRNELQDIHEKDIGELSEEKKNEIEMKQSKYEKKLSDGRHMNEIIEEVEKEKGNNENNVNIDSDWEF